jgi:lysophospholipase L1-like esterase
MVGETVRPLASVGLVRAQLEHQEHVMKARTRERLAGAVVTTAAVLAALLVVPPTTSSATASGRHWVTAWSAAAQGPSTVSGSGPETFSGYSYLQAAQGLAPPPTAFADQTIRQVMFLHHGGRSLRIQLSNEYGARPVHFAAVSIGARRGETGAAIAPGTVRTVTFQGRRGVTIAPGRRTLSDPVHLAVRGLRSVVVSLYARGATGPATVHGNAQQTFYSARGNHVRALDDASYRARGVTLTPYTSTLTTAYYWVTAIHVETGRAGRTLVTLGDSITDGFFSSGNANRRYPDVLARRLLANPATANLSVANEAISGSRVLRDGIGPRIMDRLASQVFSHPNLAGVIYLQGINDFGTAVWQLPSASADEVIEGYKRLAAAMHARGVPIYIGTLTPSGDLLRPAAYGAYSTPDTNRKRQLVNAWIRTEGRAVFDGVIDFDRAVRNASFPNQMALRYDSLDSLHPNDAGYARMANSIPMWILEELAAG